MPPPPADDQPRPAGMTGEEYRVACAHDLRGAYRAFWLLLPREARPAFRLLRARFDDYYTNRGLDDDERLWTRILAHFPDQAAALDEVRNHLLGQDVPGHLGVCAVCGATSEWAFLVAPTPDARQALAALLATLQPPARQLLAETIGPVWAAMAQPAMDYTSAR